MKKNSILLRVCDLPKENIKNLGLSFRDIGIRCNKIIKKYSLKNLKNEDILKNQKKLRRELSNWVNDPKNLVNSQGNYIGDKFGARITICLADGLVIQDVETFCRDVKNKNNRVLGKNNNYIFLKNDIVSLDLTNQEFIYSTLNTTTLNTNPFNSNIKYTNLRAYKVKSSTVPSSNSNSDVIQYSPNDTSDGDDIDIVSGSGEVMDLRTTRKEFIQATVRRYGYASRVSKQIVTTNPIVTTNHHVCKDVEGENEIYCRLSYFEFPAPTIIDVAVADGRFKKLFSAIKTARLVDALSGPGPFTVFAPTDDAFGKLPGKTLEDLLKPGNLSKLQQVLKYHVLPGKVMEADLLKLKNDTPYKTLEGLDVTISVKSDSVFVNNVKITITDVLASNGVIHVVDAVVLPFSHPPLPPKTIVDVASADERFKTLVTAVKAAGLVDALSGPGPFTVFAPTDDVFAKIPKLEFDALLANPDRLKQVLLNHVLPGKVTAADIIQGINFVKQNSTSIKIKTLAGFDVTCSVKDGSVFVNNAKVIDSDIVASDGVIHVINGVLLPPPVL